MLKNCFFPQEMTLRNSFLIAIITGSYHLLQKVWPWLGGLIFMFQLAQSQKHVFTYNGKNSCKFYYQWQQFSFKYLRLNVSLLLFLVKTYKQFLFYSHHELNSQSQAAAILEWCIIERKKFNMWAYYPPTLALYPGCLIFCHYQPINMSGLSGSDWQGACSGNFYVVLTIIFT
jgi:hypothetical protein